MNGEAEAHRRVEEAVAHGHTALDLSDLGITQLPAQTVEPHDVTELCLDGNPLAEWPTWLGDRNLTKLSLNNCRRPRRRAGQRTSAI